MTLLSPNGRPILATGWPNLEPKLRSTRYLANHGSDVMRDYRAYILGIDGHRFVKVKDFASDQPDDVAALSAAKKLVDGHDVELWDCGRLVARLASSGEVASPELAPFMAPLTASEGENRLPAEPSPGSEVAHPAFTGNDLSLGW